MTKRRTALLALMTEKTGVIVRRRGEFRACLGIRVPIDRC